MVEKINEICAFVNNHENLLRLTVASLKEVEVIKEPPMPSPTEANQPPDVDLTNEIHKGGKVE
jgi:hypothetical protein